MRYGSREPAAPRRISYVYVHSDHILVGYCSGRWVRYTEIPMKVHTWMADHPNQVKYVDIKRRKSQ